MDREQAIKIIKDCKEKGFKHTFYTLDEYYEALDMAIRALEQQPCEDEELDFVQPHKKIEVDLVKFDTPYTDTISRQAAIDAMREDTCWSCWDAKYILEHLPYVNPQANKEDIHREREQAYMRGYEDAHKQGWHDAIGKALDEAYDIVIDGERFSVVQEETLIGLGMAYEQVSTEKIGVEE